MKMLICDIQVHLEGHNLGYVQNIIRYLENNLDENEYIFLLNPEAALIPSIATKAENINIVFFTEEEFKVFYEEKNIVKSTVQIWKHLEVRLREHQIDHLVLMVLDLFQHTVGLSKYKVAISGILFQPYTRLIPSDTSFKSLMSHKLRQVRKSLTVRFMLRNKRLENVFILNDLPTATQLNDLLSTKVFTYLPDPVYDYPNDDAVLTIRREHEISEGRTILLCFGMIDDKKNVAKIIEAAKELTQEEASRLCILIVGKVRSGYEIPLQKSIDSATEHRPELQIVQVKGFVTDAEMESYVKQSDWLSLAYVNFYSSSGVIGLSARHNKPILATKFGVIGQQATDYGLGILIDARDTLEITEGFRLLINSTHGYPKAASRFVQEHSPGQFVKTLLSLR